MTNLLSLNNSKLKKNQIYSFGLPAVVTCPFAGECRSWCYATQGAYRYGVVKNARQRALDLSKTDQFVDLITSEIHRRGVTMLRVHDSGDYYCKKYCNKWAQIMRNCPGTIFYSYTKSIKLVKSIDWPKNFRPIYSYGGKQDRFIDPLVDRHARVFPSITELRAHQYVCGTDTDLTALIDPSNKIGLIYHGAKSFT